MRVPMPGTMGPGESLPDASEAGSAWGAAVARRRCAGMGGAFGGRTPEVPAFASAGGSGLQATPVQCHCKPCLDMPGLSIGSAPMRCGDLSRHLLGDFRPSARSMRAFASRSLAAGRCTSASSAALAISPGGLPRSLRGSIGIFRDGPSVEQAESRRCLLHNPNICSASVSPGAQSKSPFVSSPMFSICKGGTCGLAELPEDLVSSVAAPATGSCSLARFPAWLACGLDTRRGSRAALAASTPPWSGVAGPVVPSPNKANTSFEAASSRSGRRFRLGL